jgi:putative IMPACT (imprinted ancient) family translation regulator
MATQHFYLIDPKVTTLSVSRSNFIAHGYYIESESEIKALQANLKLKYFDASHIAYAYKIDDTSYCIDDKEPSHSAGVNILKAIEQANLNNIVIFVARYFGGTKLGLPNLNKAYYNASCLLIESNELSIKSTSDLYALEISYDNHKEVLQYLEKNNCKIKTISHQDRVIIEAYNVRVEDISYLLIKWSHIETLTSFTKVKK